MQTHHRDRLLRIALPLIPLLIALAIAVQIRTQPGETGIPGPAVDLEPLRFNSGTLLAAHFANELNYAWPPEDAVPAVAIQAFPDDLSSLPVATKKSVFFRALLPMVLAENRRIQVLRSRIREIDESLNADPAQTLNPTQQEFVASVLHRYRVEGDIRDAGVRDILLRRVDTVPAGLALAQAANESGWGTSRFTREANNLFGEWTWNEDNGLLPRRRNEGASHFIRVFPSLHGSVRSYIHNLNTGHAYSYLRQIRERYRNRGQSPTATSLARGLERYSERGEAYVEEIQSMIRYNRLDSLPTDLMLREPEKLAENPESPNSP